jgi:hypothetical protein
LHRNIYRRICREEHGEFPWHWHVHHIDADRVNNDPSNLIAVPAELHVRVHKLRPLPTRDTITIMLTSYQNQLNRFAELNRELKRLKREAQLVRKEIRRLRVKL